MGRDMVEAESEFAKFEFAKFEFASFPGGPPSPAKFCQFKFCSFNFAESEVVRWRRFSPPAGGDTAAASGAVARQTDSQADRMTN